MKTFPIDDVRGLAEEATAALGVQVTIGPRQMYGKESIR